LGDDAAPLLNLLVAYPFLTGPILKRIGDNLDRIRFLVDSGAFTAWKAGKVIELDDYCRFLETLPVTPWRYFVLDVVGDPAGTMRNYEAMLRRGFKPIPIFTRGEDPSVLDDYYKTSDVVGLGGLVGTPGNRGFINGIMKRVGSRRCHWLGFTQMAFLKHYRPYMVDTSAWAAGVMYGSFALYMGRGRTEKIGRLAFAQRPAPEILEAIASYGIDPLAFARNEHWMGTHSLNRRLNAHSVVRMSLEIQRELGTLFFASDCRQQSMILLLEGYEYERTHRHEKNRAHPLGGGGQRDPGLRPAG